MSKILIAEDEPALLDSYCELIASLGHEPIPALDGDEAIQLARRHVPDLVVTDYMMPHRDGIAVVDALRRDPALADVPVIMLSAGRPPAREASEAFVFLPKPVTLRRFESAVQDGLRGARGTAPPPVGTATAPGARSPVTLAREQMLSWVAHEIKSPISAAIMACELTSRGLATGEDPANLEKRLVVLRRQLRRMDELATSILDAAQLQDGRLRLDLEPVDLHDLVGRVTANWRDLYPDHDFSLVDGRDVVVDGDPERLRQILDNLISNAVKYGTPGRRVRIAVTAGEHSVGVSVTDEGRGIPTSELPHIFDRFHRVAGQGGRGHGLGLYISAQLARLHGGTIKVESELGRGSAFTLVLPRR